MGLPGQPPPSSHPGHGPFGDKAFRFGLRMCLALIVLGVVMMVVGGKAVSGVGTAFVVLAGVGLLTSLLGLFAEGRVLRRRAQSPPPSRRTPPPPGVNGRSNGHSRLPRDRG